MSFNEAYRGTPPWDIGRPQPEFVKLADSNQLKGDVIDIGCGTGEQAIFVASRGHRALGVDSAPLAIEKARAKARARHSKAEFIVADALDLGALGRTFDTALDSALFHVFSDRERTAYVESLRRILTPQGKYFMLCFSEDEPSDWGGPRRVTRAEIQESFSNGWKVDFIRPARLETHTHAEGGKAWLSGVTKVESP